MVKTIQIATFITLALSCLAEAKKHHKVKAHVDYFVNSDCTSPVKHGTATIQEGKCKTLGKGFSSLMVEVQRLNPNKVCVIDMFPLAGCAGTPFSHKPLEDKASQCLETMDDGLTAAGSVKITCRDASQSSSSTSTTVTAMALIQDINGDNTRFSTRFTFTSVAPASSGDRSAAITSTAEATRTLSRTITKTIQTLSPTTSSPATSRPTTSSPTTLSPSTTLTATAVKVLHVVDVNGELFSQVFDNPGGRTTTTTTKTSFITTTTFSLASGSATSLASSSTVTPSAESASTLVVTSTTTVTPPAEPTSTLVVITSTTTVPGPATSTMTLSATPAESTSTVVVVTSSTTVTAAEPTVVTSTVVVSPTNAARRQRRRALARCGQATTTDKVTVQPVLADAKRGVKMAAEFKKIQQGNNTAEGFLVRNGSALSIGGYASNVTAFNLQDLLDDSPDIDLKAVSGLDDNVTPVLYDDEKVYIWEGSVPDEVYDDDDDDDDYDYDYEDDEDDDF